MVTDTALASAAAQDATPLASLPGPLPLARTLQRQRSQTSTRWCLETSIDTQHQGKQRDFGDISAELSGNNDTIFIL